MSAPTRYDDWLTDDGPAALVVREWLAPVEGPDGVLFPATFAAEDGADRDPKKFQGGYNIDTGPDGKKVCLVDSVGSQANRIEPLFAREGYAGLVPQIVVTAGDKRINLLEAGHRAGDAVVRSTPLQKRLHAAFKAVRDGDCTPLAKIAPTSLVFGVWDSRNTQVKLPRLVASVIRAYDVTVYTRSAQYVPATEYEKDGLLPPPADLKLTDKKYGERGFSHVPASATPGGITAKEVRRDATLSLAALRLLTAGDPARTLTLRRYVLGLSLVALTANPSPYLRQGCNLVPDTARPREFKLVHADGRAEPFTLSHADAIPFAREAAGLFGIEADETVGFDPELARKDVTGEGDAEKSKTAKAKAVKEKK